MKNLSSEHIRTLLQKCLDGEYKVEGWQHPLGFAHIKIYDGTDKKIRLHHWGKKMEESQMGEPSRIHNHCFDFTSYILKGELVEKYYTIIVDSFGPDTVWDIQNLGGKAKLHKTKVKCRKVAGEKINHPEGTNYDMKAGVFHDTINLQDNTITLVFETPRPEVESLKVSANHIEEVNGGDEAWPTMNNEEIFRIINLAIN